MSFWNNDKYLSGLLTDDELSPTEPPKPTVKVQTNGLYSTSGIGAFDVDVPQGTVPSGTLPITENGAYDVTEYAEAEVDVPQGITPSGSITLTSENTYDVTDKASAVVDFAATRADLAEAVTAKGVDTLPTSSFDTIATNIGLIAGGGGLPSSISKIDGGSFSFAADTNAQNQKISHNLGVVPKGFFVWTDDITEVSSSGNYLINAIFQLLQHYNDVSSLVEGFRNVYYMSTYKRTSNLTDYPKENQISNYVTSTTIDPYRGTTSYKAGCTYKWLAWA